MPTTPDISTEVVARSFGSETAGITLTPDQQAAQARGTELRKKFEEVKDSDPLATLRKDKEPEVPLSKMTDEAVETQVNNLFGEPKDGEPDRRIEAKEEIRKLKILAEKGLGGGGPGELTTAESNAFVKKYIDNVLRKREAFRNLSTNDADLNAQLEAIARAHFEDVATKSGIASALSEKISPDADTETDETRKLTALEAQMEQDEINRIDRVKEYGNAEKRLQDLEKRKQDLRKPDTTTDPDDKGGELYQRMQKLTTEQAAAKDIMDLKTAINGWPAEKQQANRLRVEQVIEANKKLGKETTEKDLPSDDFDGRNMLKVIKYEANSEELKGLTTDIDTIDDQLESQEKTIQNLEKDLTTMASDGVKSQTEIIKLQTKIDAQKQELLDSLKSVVTDTGNDQMEKAIAERMQAYKQEQAEKAKASNDADIKKLEEARKDRWSYVDNSKRGHPRLRYRGFQQDSDWVNALTNGDVKGEVRSMLMQDLMPNPGDAPEELQRKQEERDRINKRLTDDKDFVQQQSELYVQDLLTSRLMAGKVPFGGEIAVLKRNGWDKLIEKSVAENDSLRNLIDSKLGAAGGHGRIEMLQHEYGENWLSILGMLMAGMVVPGYVGRRLMNEEMGRSR